MDMDMYRNMYVYTNTNVVLTDGGCRERGEGVKGQRAGGAGGCGERKQKNWKVPRFDQ
jgi:hypothetical protein